MKASTAYIHDERIDYLSCEIEELSSDVDTSIKKVRSNLLRRYGDGSIEAQKKWGLNRPPSRELIMWLQFGREKINDTICLLQRIADELDDIEDEVNKDEINNADK